MSSNSLTLHLPPNPPPSPTNWQQIYLKKPHQKIGIKYHICSCCGRLVFDNSGTVDHHGEKYGRDHQDQDQNGHGHDGGDGHGDGDGVGHGDRKGNWNGCGDGEEDGGRVEGSLTDLIQGCLDCGFYDIGCFLKMWGWYRTAKPGKAFIMVVQKLCTLFHNFHQNMHQLLSKKLSNPSTLTQTPSYKALLLQNFKQHIENKHPFLKNYFKNFDVGSLQEQEREILGKMGEGVVEGLVGVGVRVRVGEIGGKDEGKGKGKKRRQRKEKPAPQIRPQQYQPQQQTIKMLKTLKINEETRKTCHISEDWLQSLTSLKHNQPSS